MILPKNQLLKIPMYLSSTHGMWPIIFINNKKLKRIYDVFAFILAFYFIEYIVRAYYQLTVLLRADVLNLEEILGNLCITLIYTVSMFRLKAFNSKKVKTLFLSIIETEEQIMNDSEDDVKKIYESFLKVNFIYNLLFFFNGWVVSVLYFVHPFLVTLPTMELNNQTVIVRILPLSTWWPIDVQKHYWLAYCWNIFDGTLGSSFVINSDMLTFTLIVFALSQLNILSHKLRKFTKKQNFGKNDQFHRDQFVSLIKEHQKIINYIDTFNDAMKNVMLFDFLQCSVQLATITLQLLVSQHLALDIWSTDWYVQRKDIKQMIWIFIARAQRPLQFLIGPFGSMSLQTFIAILKATYSYMMLFINTSG
ncbi:unnamed protein product [Ceutorhynchus assimilis]|uniref:Odorant receptor n=1 Tax=Ceutorhynchus assimilis TaxID=467358 RepID=A0A9N9MUL3_9CUCU|nr:unnamed protein product [Ceutorhynchus assimilis]